MATKKFTKQSVTESIEIRGHRFEGLDAVRKAVSRYAIYPRASGYKPDIFDADPKGTIPGLHVLMVYERYPCFDSYDYASEDRVYANFFFSREPFTRAQIVELCSIPPACNVRLVNEKTPEWAFPAIYHDGDSPTMLVGTIE